MPEGQCPFCQLIQSGEVMQVYENESAVAFLDINPRAEGHTIVAPKEHHAALADTPSATLADLMDAVQVVAEKVQAVLGAEGVSVLANAGEVAGQRVPHFYFQVFPRYGDEENAGVPAGAVFQPIEMDEAELSSLAGELAAVSTGGEESGAEETAAQRIRSGTQYGLPTEEVSQQAEGKEETGEATQTIEPTPASPAGPEPTEQAQPPQSAEAPVQEPPRGEEPRFTTSEEVEEDYPDMDNITVKRGIDMDKYEPHALEIEAFVRQNYTEVEFREKGQETKFTLDTTHEREIVRHIASHFEIDEDLVADRITFRYVKFEDRSLVPRAGYDAYKGEEASAPITPTTHESETDHDRAEFV